MNKVKEELPKEFSISPTCFDPPTSFETHWKCQGKMWRVVKSMFSTVQSAVLIGDEKTEWFELYTGVRQGV